MNKITVIRFNGKPSLPRILDRLSKVFDASSTGCSLLFMPGSSDPLTVSPDFYQKLAYELREHLGPLALSRLTLRVTTYADARKLDEPWPHHLATAFQNNLYLLTPWPLDAETEDAIILSKRYGIEPRWVVKLTKENYLDVFLEFNRLNINLTLDLPAEGSDAIVKDLTERWMTDRRSRVSIFPIERFIHRCLTAQQGQNQPPMAVYILDNKGASEIALPELQCKKCQWSSMCSPEFLLLSNGHILLCDNPGERLMSLCETLQGYYPFLRFLISRINIREATEYARLFF